MAHFYGTMNGGRKDKTCMGHKPQGIKAHIRGWDVGVQVIGKHDFDADVFHIYATSGSNSKQQPIYLGSVRLSETDGSIQFCNDDIQPKKRKKA